MMVRTDNRLRTLLIVGSVQIVDLATTAIGIAAIGAAEANPVAHIVAPGNPLFGIVIAKIAALVLVMEVVARMTRGWQTFTITTLTLIGLFPAMLNVALLIGSTAP